MVGLVSEFCFMRRPLLGIKCAIDCWVLPPEMNEKVYVIWRDITESFWTLLRPPKFQRRDNNEYSQEVQRQCCPSIHFFPWVFFPTCSRTDKGKEKREEKLDYKFIEGKDPILVSSVPLSGYRLRKVLSKCLDGWVSERGRAGVHPQKWGRRVKVGFICAPLAPRFPNTYPFIHGIPISGPG